MKKLSVKQLKRLMNVDNEAFAKYLFDNGTIVLDTQDEIQNKRETYYLYKDCYFYYVRNTGELTTVGWETSKPFVVQHWEQRGYTYVIKTKTKPLGTIRENVFYIVRE